MAPRADVEEDAGSAGCAEAESHNLSGQVHVCVQWLAQILPVHAGRFWDQVITDQRSCLEERSYVCNINTALWDGNVERLRETWWQWLFKESHSFLNENLSSTFSAEGSVISRVAAVARVAVVFLHTLPSVAAVHPETGAVTRTSGFNSRSDLCSFFQV